MFIATIRTIIFYCFSVPFTMVWAMFWGLSAALVPYPLRYFLVIGGWAYAMHFFVTRLLGIRVRVHGRDNIPAEPCVIMSNHQSAWETYYLQLLFRPQSQVIKSSLLKIPFFGWTFGMIKPIAIDRSDRRRAIAQVIEQGVERIQQGASVLIFPEGTRTLPRRLLPFKRGGAVLAKAAGCAVVPVTHNSGEFWINNGFAKRAGVIDLYIHKPMATANVSAEALTEQVEGQVKAQLATLYAQGAPVARGA